MNIFMHASKKHDFLFVHFVKLCTYSNFLNGLPSTCFPNLKCFSLCVCRSFSFSPLLWWAAVEMWACVCALAIHIHFKCIICICKWLHYQSEYLWSDGQSHRKRRREKKTTSQIMRTTFFFLSFWLEFGISILFLWAFNSYVIFIWNRRKRKKSTNTHIKTCQMNVKCMAQLIYGDH